MNAIGSLIMLGLVITLGQIAWQFATWTDPLKEVRKHGKHTRR